MLFAMNSSKNEIDFIENEDVRITISIIYLNKENWDKEKEEVNLEDSIVKDLLDTWLLSCNLKLYVQLVFYWIVPQFREVFIFVHSGNEIFK